MVLGKYSCDLGNALRLRGHPRGRCRGQERRVGSDGGDWERPESGSKWILAHLSMPRLSLPCRSPWDGLQPHTECGCGQSHVKWQSQAHSPLDTVTAPSLNRDGVKATPALLFLWHVWPWAGPSARGNRGNPGVGLGLSFSPRVTWWHPLRLVVLFLRYGINHEISNVCRDPRMDWVP